MNQQQQFRWRPSSGQLLWAGGIAALVFLVIVICGYLFEWKWTGLSTPNKTRLTHVA
jgi:NADH:ubiquinone oxidoreductase subunit 3 (subunit A)